MNIWMHDALRFWGSWRIVQHVSIPSGYKSLPDPVITENYNVMFSLVHKKLTHRRIYASVIQPSLVQIMDCHLGGAKPSEPMQEYV